MNCKEGLYWVLGIAYRFGLEGYTVAFGRMDRMVRLAAFRVVFSDFLALGGGLHIPKTWLRLACIAGRVVFRRRIL